MKHSKQEVTVYGDDHKETHELYVVFLPESLKILYIGEGLKGRHKHTFSGKSHVRALNTIHKRGVSIRVDVMVLKIRIEVSS